MTQAIWTPTVLDDDVLERSVAAPQAVEWMREAVLAVEEGRLAAPARTFTDLGEGRLVFTTGALADEWFGYRSYDTFGIEAGEQVVVVQSARTAQVLAVAVGSSLGQIRTGALGGLAADVLARPDAGTVGVIGSGSQAWRQVWAIAGTRELDHVSIYSPTSAHAEAFAHRVLDELGVSCAIVGSAEAAVRDRGIVVLATSSRAPVIEATWLAPGTHVTTVGPKQQHASEFGLDLVEAASVVVTDSPAQLHAYDPPGIVATSEHAEHVRSLGAVVAGTAPGRHDDSDVTLYLSVGLAGTEVHLLHRVVTLCDQSTRQP